MFLCSVWRHQHAGEGARLQRRAPGLHPVPHQTFLSAVYPSLNIALFPPFAAARRFGKQQFYSVGQRRNYRSAAVYTGVWKGRVINSAGFTSSRADADIFKASAPELVCALLTCCCLLMKDGATAEWSLLRGVLFSGQRSHSLLHYTAALWSL